MLFWCNCFPLIINTFYCSLMLLFLFQHLLVRQMDCLYHLKFTLNLILVYIFVLSLLEGISIGIYSLFLSNNRQHMSLCAEMISSYIRNVWGIAKAHVSFFCPWCCSIFCLAAGFSLVSKFPFKLDILFLFTSLLWYVNQYSIEWAVLGLSE